MEQSQPPPSLTPPTSISDEAEYWCYCCDTTALVKTLANCSEIVCRECNCVFVELISSIEVSDSPDHVNGDVDDDEFAEENDSESGNAYYENDEDYVIDDEVEDDDDEVQEEVEDDDDDEIEEDSGSDDEGEEDGEMYDYDDEEEEEGHYNENASNSGNLETGISEFRLELDNLQTVMHRLAAILSDFDIERMSLEDDEDETDGDERTGAPPAAESVVLTLKTVDVEAEKDVIHCAVCKDLVSVGEVAKELGCGHGYHEECILPWLGLRNTCPVCRFELPTDDADYEEKRKKKLVGASASGNNPGPE